jgi:4-amino-4-deoxy-L-arabinose transferase-like glycosyltransferase
LIPLVARSIDPREFHAGANPAAWAETKRILLAALFVRLLLGALVPLFPDETYYWEWSRNLSLGYFDHPPVLAWLIRAGTEIFGDTAFGVRVFSIVAGSACALALAHAARSLGGDAAARLCALIFTVMPIVAAGSVLATPDAPMLCAAAWAIYAVLRALGLPPRAQDPDTPAVGLEAMKWWLVAGASMGIAMASKYTSILVPLSMLAAFVAHAKLQNRFGQAGPYVAVAVATLVMVPVISWNALNDWVSFRFQLSHGLGTPRGGAMGAVNRELELIGGQIGLVSPILFYFVARAVRDALRFSEEGFRLILGLLAVLPIAFFIYSATRRPVEANWPAIAWLSAVVLLATDLPHSARMRAWLGRGIGLAAVLSAIVYIHVIVPIIPLPAPRDQVAKAFGWDLVASTIERKIAQLQQSQGFGTGPVHVAAERYQDASEVAFNLSGRPRVFSLNLTGRANQYDLWPQFADIAELGSTMILVLDDERDEPRVIRKLSCCFARIDESEGVTLMRRSQVISRKRIWILTGKRDGWPVRDQPFPPSN